jgi:hypothetical protein
LFGTVVEKHIHYGATQGGLQMRLEARLYWFSRNWKTSAGVLSALGIGRLRFVRHGGML